MAWEWCIVFLGRVNLMTEIAEKLKEEILRLPTHDRAELAYCLIRSLDMEDADIQMAWEDELERRWQEMESGRVVGEPAENVFAELRKKYP
jgi:putative addiction module component (TIGR02574 family)